jgi:hypothetical protein
MQKVVMNIFQEKNFTTFKQMKVKNIRWNIY